MSIVSINSHIFMSVDNIIRPLLMLVNSNSHVFGSIFYKEVIFSACYGRIQEEIYDVL